MFSNSKQLFLPPKRFSNTIPTSLCVSAWTIPQPFPHKQQRGYPFPSASQPNSRTMAVVPSKINSDHRSALTRQTQQCGKRVLRLQRMANRPTSDPALPKKVQCRSLCVTPNESALNLRQLETRPRGYLHRCPRLVPSQRLRLSTIQSDRTSTETSVSGQSRFGLSGPSMAGTTLVASPPEPVNQESCHDPKLQTPAEGPCVPSENPSNVPQASFSRLSVIREQHQTEGFSEDITRILQSATRASTHKTYQSAWGLWHSWCAKRQFNSISATLNDVLLFLTDRFNSGAAYRSVNVARSAISPCHAMIDGYPVGQHPLVIQLLKGMLNMRPPKPRYTHTWDVHLVTKYLSSLGKTKLLPLKLLSIKLAMPGTRFVSCKAGPPTLPCSPRRSFLHSRVSAKARLSRSTTSSLFCVFSTQRETLSRWHFTPLPKGYTKLTSSFCSIKARPFVCFLHQTASSNHYTHSEPMAPHGLKKCRY